MTALDAVTLILWITIVGLPVYFFGPMRHKSKRYRVMSGVVGGLIGAGLGIVAGIRRAA